MADNFMFILVVESISILILIFVIVRILRGVKLLNNRINILSGRLHSLKKQFKDLEDKQETEYNADEELRKILEKDFSK